MPQKLDNPISLRFAACVLRRKSPCASKARTILFICMRLLSREAEMQGRVSDTVTRKNSYRRNVFLREVESGRGENQRMRARKGRASVTAHALVTCLVLIPHAREALGRAAGAQPAVD